MDDIEKNLVRTVALGWIRHVLTMAAGALVTAGLMTNGDVTPFVTIGSGIAFGAVGLAWSWWQKQGHDIIIKIVKRQPVTLPATP